MDFNDHHWNSVVTRFVHQHVRREKMSTHTKSSWMASERVHLYLFVSKYK